MLTPAKAAQNCSATCHQLSVPKGGDSSMFVQTKQDQVFVFMGTVCQFFCEILNSFSPLKVGVYGVAKLARERMSLE